MTDTKTSALERRRFLKAVSSVVVLAPLGGLVACSGEPEPAAPPKPAQPSAAKNTPPPAPAEPAPAEPAPSAPTRPQPAANANLPLLAETDPQAQALGYVGDAAGVDTSRFPQYTAGSRCENCALYQGKPGSEQAPCPIFAGRQVRATGWCSAYSPKA